MKFFEVGKIFVLAAILGITTIFTASTVAFCETAEPTEASDEVQTTLSGAGTEENPYLVGSKSELMYVTQLAEAGLTKDKYFELNADILLNEIDKIVYEEGVPIGFSDGAEAWTPIGTEQKPFEGNFDGKKHSVTGLYCKADKGVSGLFGVVKDAAVKNVNIDFSVADGGEYVGLVAGKATGTSEISGCTVSGTLSTDAVRLSVNIGGVVGSVSDGTTVSDCCSYAVLTGKKFFLLYAGGIAGINNGEIDKCTFAGSVKAFSSQFNANIGGIAAGNFGTVKGCRFDGSVYGKTTDNLAGCNAGGIVGYSEGEISDCISTGDVSGYCASYADSIFSAGGIAGYVKNGNVAKCSVCGSIGGEQGVYAGGILGIYIIDGGERKIEDCLFTGEVASAYGISGGICASVSAEGYVTDKAELIRCVSTAEISGQISGGAVARTFSDGAEIDASSCYYLEGKDNALEEGFTAMSESNFKSGTPLTGFEDNSVWSFTSGSLPELVVSETAKASSVITAEKSQLISVGNGVKADGTGEMTLSKTINTKGTYSVIVRFGGDEKTFEPMPVIVEVTVVSDTAKCEILSVDLSALAISSGKLSGNISVKLYSPEAEKALTAITGIFVDGKYAESVFTPVTTQKGVFSVESIFVGEVTIEEGEKVTVKTFVVQSTETMSPVCENAVSVFSAN